MRVVDEAFPANRGAWLFEVDTHDDEEVISVFVRKDFEFFAILDGGFGIVDGAGTDDDEETVVFSEENVLSFLTRFGDEVSRCF